MMHTNPAEDFVVVTGWQCREGESHIWALLILQSGLSHTYTEEELMSLRRSPLEDNIICTVSSFYLYYSQCGTITFVGTYFWVIMDRKKYKRGK